MKSATAASPEEVTPSSLSGQLEALFRNPGAPDLTLNELLERTEDRGPYGLIILLCLPFMAPFTLPGISNLFGVVIVMLAWRVLRGRSARLPRRIGRRKVQGRVLARVISASIRVLGWIERFTCCRGPQWLQSTAARRVNALVLVYGGLMLAAPIPPVIPFSNLTPAIGILLVAASMMERDGVMIWAGYAATAGATAYIAVMAVLNIHLLLAAWRWIAEPAQALFRRILG